MLSKKQTEKIRSPAVLLKGVFVFVPGDHKVPLSWLLLEEVFKPDK